MFLPTLAHAVSPESEESASQQPNHARSVRSGKVGTTRVEHPSGWCASTKSNSSGSTWDSVPPLERKVRDRRPQHASTRLSFTAVHGNRSAAQCMHECCKTIASRSNQLTTVLLLLPQVGETIGSARIERFRAKTAGDNELCWQEKDRLELAGRGGILPSPCLPCNWWQRERHSARTDAPPYATCPRFVAIRLASRNAR